MIKPMLIAVLLGAAPLALSAADNLNVMPWVNGTEWPNTSVEKKSDGSYIVNVTEDWQGAGVDFATDHPDFSLEGFTGVHIDVTADGGGNKMVYVNYSDGSYFEAGTQPQAATYMFDNGKTVEKIVFKFERAGTYTMRAFTLLAPSDANHVELASGQWRLDNWGDKHQIPSSAFADVKTGDKLTITYSASGGAQAQIYAPKRDGEVNANSASETCHLYTTVTNNGIYADLPQGDNLTISVTLTDDMVVYLKQYGLSLEGHGVTFTKIELTSGNNTVDVDELPEPVIDPVTPNEGLGGIPMGVAPKVNLPLLFDNASSTTFRAARGDRAWAGLDLQEQYVIKKVKWMAADNDSWKVNLGVFEGANNADFSDALPIYIIRSSKGAGEWNEADITCSRGFRYVRYVGPRRLINAGANGGAGGSEGSHAEMAELRFFGEKGAGDDSNLYRFTNLPTVILNTVDMEEPHDMNVDPDKEDDLIATLTVIDSNGNIVSAPGITRERGNHSRTFPKRPLRMKFDKKNTPVATAKAKKKKWELLNNYGDKTLMRNLVAFDIAHMLGMEYVPFCTPVDVILNGEYRGCYQLADSKEVDTNRVNIHEMTLEEAQAGGEGLTGGYFLEVDAYADKEPAGTWFTSIGYSIPVTVKAPDDKDVLFQCDAPLKYITDYYSTMASRVRDGKFSGDGNYREMFDVESFLQLLMTNEVGGNKDVMWSFNMYKDQGDPHIYSGPAWDFDVAFDNSQYIEHQAYDNNSYLYKNTPSVAGGFRDFTDMVMSDPQTAAELRHLWGAARDNGLTYDYLAGQIDYYASLIAESQKLNFERWPILDVPVHDSAIARGSFEAEVGHVKDFCKKIISHFDSKIGYTAGDHSDMIVPAVDDSDAALRLSVPYGKLMVKDEIINAPAASPARAAAVGKFVNADKNWSIDKSTLDSDHLVTFYARHAGRESAMESLYVSSDGTVSAIDSVNEETEVGAPKEYFNLTGVKVNPSETTPGVYICRQGSKVTKVILR